MNRRWVVPAMLIGGLMLLPSFMLGAWVGFRLEEEMTPGAGSEVEALHERLESGSVEVGDSSDGWYSKPRSEVSVFGPGGRQFYYSVYWNERRVIGLYECDGSLFAAHMIQAAGGPHIDRWYFCDQELMADYLELAVQAGDWEGQ